MLLTTLKETLFPCFCVSCEAEGEWWCADCRAAFPVANEQYCPVCHRSTSRGQACMECATQSALARVTALYAYQEKSSIGVLIKLCKYHGAYNMVSLWIDILDGRVVWQADTVLVPVPLHQRRLRERGFNQALLIAEALSRVTGLRVDANHLIRERYTAQQAKLDRAGRFLNMENAFAWTSTHAPNRVVLVDDVYTTGATMQACASTLARAGAQTVEGFVLARD